MAHTLSLQWRPLSQQLGRSHRRGPPSTGLARTSAERSSRDCLPCFHATAIANGHNATHRCDGIKSDSAEWQFDYGREFFFYSGRKFFVEKANVRIARRVYSHSQRLPKVAAQLFERLIRFKPHEKSFRKFP